MKTAITQPLPSAIVDKAVKEAVRYLTSAKVRFAILMPDGSKLGELDIKPARVRGSPKQNFRHTGYREVVEKMQPGDVHTFQTPEGLKAHDYRSAISAAAGSIWGKGHTMTVISGDKVDLMRLAD